MSAGAGPVQGAKQLRDGAPVYVRAIILYVLMRDQFKFLNNVVKIGEVLSQKHWFLDKCISGIEFTYLLFAYSKAKRLWATKKIREFNQVF